MTSDEEIDSPTPEAFTYRAKAEDLGRYRLTAATREARLPVRVLRGAGLRSFWAPGVGVRFDGLLVLEIFLREIRADALVMDALALTVHVANV